MTIGTSVGEKSVSSGRVFVYALRPAACLVSDKIAYGVCVSYCSVGRR